jgi:hypothetical protein
MTCFSDFTFKCDWPSDKGNKSVRSDKSDKGDRSVRSEKSDKGDRSVKSDRSKDKKEDEDLNVYDDKASVASSLTDKSTHDFFEVSHTWMWSH